jgi:hypothetical protein
MTVTEITASYEYARSWAFEYFENSCAELVECLLRLIPEAKDDILPRFPITEGILVLVNAVGDRDLLTEDELDRGRLKTFKDLVGDDSSKYLARIPSSSINKANESLANQLCAIMDSALSYIWVDHDNQRLLFENNLVRAGAELRDWLLNKLMRLDLHEPFYQNFRGPALDFIAIYERLLNSYDILAALKRPEPAMEPDQLKRIESQLAQIRKESKALRQKQEPAFSWHGLRNGLSQYRSFESQSFARLAELSANHFSFEDFWTDPFLSIAWRLLSSQPGLPKGIVLLSLDHRRDVKELLQIDGDSEPANQGDLLYLDQVRRILADDIFSNEPHPQSPRSLGSISIAPEFRFEENDFVLLEQAIRRGLSDPGRCGWLAVCALRIGRQKISWPAREDFKLEKDYEVSALFALAQQLYDKLLQLNYHLNAVDLRMALIWELVYDPDLPTENTPFELKKDAPRAGLILEDAQRHSVALLASQLKLRDLQDLDQIGRSFLRIERRMSFSIVAHWGRKWFGFGEDTCEFENVCQFVTDLENISSSGDWDRTIIAQSKYFVCPGSYYGPGTRTYELEEIILECLPSDSIYVSAIEQSLWLLQSLPLRSVRAYLTLRKIWPQITSFARQNAGLEEIDEKMARPLFEKLEELLSQILPETFESDPRLGLLRLIFSDGAPHAERFGRTWIQPFPWTSYQWFRRFSGFESVDLMIRKDDAAAYCEFSQFKIPHDLRFSDDAIWVSLDEDQEALPKASKILIESNGQWTSYKNRKAWHSSFDRFVDRVFVTKNAMKTNDDHPFLVVSDMEISLTLTAWALLRAAAQLGTKIKTVVSWLRGEETVPCLPEFDQLSNLDKAENQYSTLPLRNANIGEFLYELGFQDIQGVPTERLHSLLTLPLIEDYCLAKAGIAINENNIIIPGFDLGSIKNAFTIPRTLWYREFAMRQYDKNKFSEATRTPVSEAARATVEAVWQIMESRLLKGQTATLLLGELESYMRVVDPIEEFFYRRFRQMPVAFVALPLLSWKGRSKVDLPPQAIATFRLSGCFLTREYQRRAIRGEFGDWFRFGSTASPTYRLCAERLLGLQRFFNALAPLVT